MKDSVKKSVTDMGAVFHVVFPGVNAEMANWSASLKNVTDKAQDALVEEASGTEEWLKKQVIMFDRAALQPPHSSNLPQSAPRPASDAESAWAGSAASLSWPRR